APKGRNGLARGETPGTTPGTTPSEPWEALGVAPGVSPRASPLRPCGAQGQRPPHDSLDAPAVPRIQVDPGVWTLYGESNASTARNVSRGASAPAFPGGAAARGVALVRGILHG